MLPTNHPGYRVGAHRNPARFNGAKLLRIDRQSLAVPLNVTIMTPSNATMTWRPVWPVLPSQHVTQV